MKKALVTALVILVYVPVALADSECYFVCIAGYTKTYVEEIQQPTKSAPKTVSVVHPLCSKVIAAPCDQPGGGNCFRFKDLSAANRFLEINCTGPR